MLHFPIGWQQSPTSPPAQGGGTSQPATGIQTVSGGTKGSGDSNVTAVKVAWQGTLSSTCRCGKLVPMVSNRRKDSHSGILVLPWQSTLFTVILKGSLMAECKPEARSTECPLSQRMPQYLMSHQRSSAQPQALMPLYSNIKYSKRFPGKGQLSPW